MKVSFLDYWQAPGSFQQENNFFIHLLRKIFEGVTISDPEDADVIFSLGFGVDYTRFKDCIRIQYAGENVRPNLKVFDYSLTYDFDSYNGKNFRFPLWMMHIDWFNVGTYDNPEWLIPESYLYCKNEFTQKPKDKFCSIVYGKQIDSRINAIKNISNAYKNVDVFGKANPYIPLPDGEKHKMDLISDYKFSLCYENTVTPGYHTEKLLHGKVAGNVPIYYGDETVSEDFNINGFINAVNMSDKELVEKIKEIDSNDKLYNSIINEPIFDKKISLDNISNFFYNILN
jgi:hypothetical protein